jgi:hypothetical protein
MLGFDWALAGLGLLLIAWLVRRTIRRAKELEARIDQFHREQEAAERLRQQGLLGPANPYADLAELYREKDEGDAGK